MAHGYADPEELDEAGRRALEIAADVLTEEWARDACRLRGDDVLDPDSAMGEHLPAKHRLRYTRGFAFDMLGALQGTRWQGAHEQAAGHIRKAGPDGKAVAGHLTKLIRKKTQSHYEVRRLRPNEAEELVQAAERAVAVAERVSERHARP